MALLSQPLDYKNGFYLKPENLENILSMAVYISTFRLYKNGSYLKPENWANTLSMAVYISTVRLYKNWILPQTRELSKYSQHGGVYLNF